MTRFKLIIAGSIGGLLIIGSWFLINPAWAPTGLFGTTADIEPASVRLFLVGDIMLDRGVAAMVAGHGQGDFNYLFSLWDLWQPTDIVFANLEGPLSDQGQDQGGLYSFRMKPAALEVLVRAGFNVLSVANNHAGDWGQAAFVDTLHRLGQAGILHPGGGLSKASAETPAKMTVNDLTLGWLGFSDVGPDWLAAGQKEPGILLASDPQRLKIIESAAEQVDILIVSYHFGQEYQTEPNDRQRTLAESSIEAGATIVAGHHSHVIQPVERFKDGLIIYSLGNFIFDQYFSKATMTGLVVEVVLTDQGIIQVLKHISRQDETYRPRLITTVNLD